MDQKFAMAFSALPGRRILGRRLRPFSLWHCYCLELIASPFVGGDRPITFSELYLAAEICAAKPPAHCLSFPLRRLTWWRRLWMYARIYGRGRTARRQMDEFLVYLSEHNAGPDTWSAEGGGRSVKVPWSLYLATKLIARGVSRAEAWAMSPGQAKWYVAALAEAAGGESNVISDAEREALKLAGHTI
jgi:hypothetical protein